MLEFREISSKQSLFELILNIPGWILFCKILYPALFSSLPTVETENCKICINFHSWDIWHLLWELISHIFFKRGCPDTFPWIVKNEGGNKCPDAFPKKSKWMKHWAAETRSSLSKPASDWEKLIGWSRVSGKRITAPLLALGHHHPNLALQDNLISFLLAIFGDYHPYLDLRND